MSKIKGKLVGAKEIIRAIREHRTFLVTSHINPEGDALGSQLALADLIHRIDRKKHKKVWMVSGTPIPENCRFLPGSKKVSTDFLIKRDPEVLITVDCPNLDRVGRVIEYINERTLVICIDHHVSCERFGDLNWIDPKASATGQMIYYLYKIGRVPIEKTSAVNLYTSMMTDTGSFAYSNTTAETHRIVAELVAKGVNPYQVSEQIYESHSLASRRLLAKVLNSLTLTEDGKVAYVSITRQMLEEVGADAEETEGFVNYTRSIKGVEVGLLFREDDKPKWVKVSFRSKGIVDVNQVAKKLGGGGHRAASGCLIEGDLEDIKRRVLEQVHEALEAVKNKKER